VVQGGVRWWRRRDWQVERAEGSGANRSLFPRSNPVSGLLDASRRPRGQRAVASAFREAKLCVKSRAPSSLAHASNDLSAAFCWAVNLDESPTAGAYSKLTELHYID
jgi:hypothetical protein